VICVLDAVGTLQGRHSGVTGLLHIRGNAIYMLHFRIKNGTFPPFFKTVLSSGYILILLSIENIFASLIEMCQGWTRMRNVN